MRDALGGGRPLRGSRNVVPLIAAGAVLACGAGRGDETIEDPGSGPRAFRLERVSDGVIAPVDLTAPDGDSRLFVVEQAGLIRIIEGGRLSANPFIDLTDRVRSGGERGLLGLAFHPEFASNGFFYVDYTDGSGDTRIERYRVSADPAVADPASATLILAVAQPFSNHNGGQLAFGPDGYLYISLGDGGSGGDPLGHGQNTATLLGSLLRIDVDGAAPYAVPAGNPFRNRTDARPEIWAWGLRNPWRFSFDRGTGDLYIADVGQNQWEEINVASGNPAGVNYGWSLMEGLHCFRAGCSSSGLAPPILEYDHSQGCSVTGGFVYRGSDIPAIRGLYFYSDYCSGWIRSFRYQAGAATDRREWGVGDIGRVLSFGEDARGELYVLTDRGAVHRFAPLD